MYYVLVTISELANTDRSLSVSQAESGLAGASTDLGKQGQEGQDKTANAA